MLNDIILVGVIKIQTNKSMNLKIFHLGQDRDERLRQGPRSTRIPPIFFVRFRPVSVTTMNNSVLVVTRLRRAVGRAHVDEIPIFPNKSNSAPTPLFLTQEFRVR